MRCLQRAEAVRQRLGWLPRACALQLLLDKAQVGIGLRQHLAEHQQVGQAGASHQRSGCRGAAQLGQELLERGAFLFDVTQAPAVGLTQTGTLGGIGNGLAQATDAVHQATLAIKEGLDRDTALRAITLNPAKVLGIDEKVGSLSKGKYGDIVLWSGDPLDVMQRAQRVFIKGQEVYTYSADEAASTAE